MENLPEKTFLNMRERALCVQIADQKNMYGKQAQILIGLDSGYSYGELSRLLKVSQTEVKFLHSEFKEKRLSIFPIKTYKKRH